MIWVGPGGASSWTPGFHWLSCQESKRSAFWEEMKDLKAAVSLSWATFDRIVISLHCTLSHLRGLSEYLHIGK